MEEEGRWTHRTYLVWLCDVANMFQGCGGTEKNREDCVCVFSIWTKPLCMTVTLWATAVSGRYGVRECVWEVEMGDVATETHPKHFLTDFLTIHFTAIQSSWGCSVKLLTSMCVSHDEWYMSGCPQQDWTHTPLWTRDPLAWQVAKCESKICVTHCHCLTTSSSHCYCCPWVLKALSFPLGKVMCLLFLFKETDFSHVHLNLCFSVFQSPGNIPVTWKNSLKFLVVIQPLTSCTDSPPLLPKPVPTRHHHAAT